MSSTSPTSTALLDSLVSPETLAEKAHVTVRNLGEWRATGRGPKFIRVGKKPFYRPEAIDEWLLAQEHSSTSEELR